MEFCSKILGRLHPPPAEVNTPEVMKEVSLGWGVNHQVPPSKGRGHCWAVEIHLGSREMYLERLLPVGKEEMEANFKAPQMLLGCLSEWAPGDDAAGTPSWISPVAIISTQLPITISWSFFPRIVEATLPTRQVGSARDYHPPTKPSTNGSGQLLSKFPVHSPLWGPNSSFKK